MTEATSMMTTLIYKKPKQLLTTVSNISDDRGYFNDVNTHIQET